MKIFFMYESEKLDAFKYILFVYPRPNQKSYTWAGFRQLWTLEFKLLSLQLSFKLRYAHPNSAGDQKKKAWPLLVAQTELRQFCLRSFFSKNNDGKQQQPTFLCFTLPQASCFKKGPQLFIISWFSKARQIQIHCILPFFACHLQYALLLFPLFFYISLFCYGYTFAKIQSLVTSSNLKFLIFLFLQDLFLACL